MGSIGDLFVNLGIKGSEKTVGALSNVTKGLGEAKSMSIEAKAGILAVVYGLERMMSASAAQGTSLTNFAAYTGASTKALQQWQFAMRQAGGTAEEMQSSFEGVQKAMGMVDFNKGVPEGLAILSMKAGGIDWKQKEDPVYMMKKIRDGILAMGNDQQSKTLANYLAGTLNVNKDFISGVRRGKFSDENLKKAPTYNDKEIEQLTKADTAWTNLGIKIERAFGHFDAAHGSQLVGDISKLTDSVIRLAEALLSVAERFKMFDRLDEATDFTAAALDSKPGTLLGEDHLEKKIWNWLMSGDKYKNQYKPAPTMRAALLQGSGIPADKIEHNTTVIFQGHHDAPRKTVDALKTAVGNHVKQASAKVQGG